MFARSPSAGRRLPAWLAVLLIVPAAVLPGGTAAAQVCGPPSAEHAFEELLDVATDDSPVEEEAWRIADEQEARGAFETPETIRRIDDLARANGFAYDCPSRMYHPVSGPDPRDAIENDEEPPDSGAGAPVGPAPGAGAPDSGSAGPGGPETAVPTDPGPPLGEGAEPLVAGDATAPEGTSPDAGPGRPYEGSTLPGGRPAAGATDVLPAADIAHPESTDVSQGGTVALPGGPGRESSSGSRVAGVAALLGATVGLAAAARARRRRPELLN